MDIDWSNTTPKQWVWQAEQMYNHYDQKDVILAGFSFGAVSAFMLAAKRVPGELWLFSLSPLFAEDAALWTEEDYVEVGDLILSEAKTTSFRELARSVTCPVKLFAGSDELREWSDMKHRFDDASRTLADCEAVIIEGVGHEIENVKYVEAVKSTIDY